MRFSSFVFLLTRTSRRNASRFTFFANSKLKQTVFTEDTGFLTPTSRIASFHDGEGEFFTISFYDTFILLLRDSNESCLSESAIVFAYGLLV